MLPLTQLWLPIVLSAVGVFVASSVVHMVLKFWHSPDYHGFANEDEIRAAVHKGGPAPGMYVIPHCDMEEMKKPEIIAKFREGPVGFLILRPNGVVNMGRNLGQWFVYTLLVSVFAAYLAGHTLGGGAAPLQVFRVVGTAAFMAYGFGALPMAIWWGQPWGATVKAVIDGLIYGAVTAAVFAYLWPH